MAHHYVNNAEFLAALKEHKQKVREAEESGDTKPQVSNFIGECIVKIATHLSFRPNFINYTFRDEMISDGIENCLMYLDNFDPDRGNPFAYFTQIIYYAFIRRIQKEKKQTLIKGKIIMDMPFDQFELQDHDSEESFVSSYMEFMQTHGILDEVVHHEERRKAKKPKQATLDDIMESDNIEYE